MNMTESTRHKLFYAALAGYFLWLGALGSLAAVSAQAPRDQVPAKAD